jgi:hypothetical protein
MLKNFQLATVVSTGAQFRLLRIPLHQKLQNELAGNWQLQYDAFVEDVQEITFNAGYYPEKHERFILEGFALPDWLKEETSLTIQNLDPINRNEDLFDSIKCIIAFARDEQAREIFLFQNFFRSHVIQPGRFLFLEGNTYVTAQRPGLSLESKLSAVYYPTRQKLLFQSYRTVNTFLPLADFYEEATEQEIREVLAHEKLAPENTDALATNANQWFRKRFALLRDSGVLDEFTAQQIRQRSKGYDVELRISDGKIVVPADKAAAKKLLQFLNEELYRGAITKKLYETNSKREAD